MLKVARLPKVERRPPPPAAEARRGARLQTQYFAFLSYSHKDEALAAWLHRELERFHVPRTLAGKITANGVMPKRLRPIFRDEHELAAADDLGEEIRTAIACSQFLVVLCSPNAAKSRWTNAEIEAFKRVRPDGCVLAAIAAGEPFASDIPGREDEECFPPALRHKYDRRGRATGKRAEPLAADLREDGEERRTGFLKLVAGMLGVGLDELVQRNATRRHRRLGYLAAASLAGMALTSTLSVMALQARDSARDQRRDAEGLVAFMLGDLKDKLEPIGRLDALDGVGSRVLAYYSNQDASELSDAGLMQRSQALSLSGQVAYLRGDFGTAQRLYAEAMRGTAEAVGRDGTDPERLFEHAQNVFYFGSIAAERGELHRAEQAFRQYHSLARRMTALEGDNLKWKMEIQYAEANLGVVLLRQRRFAEAVRQFSAALATMQAVAAVDQSNQEYQKSVAESLAWLADAQLAGGNLNGAVEARGKQVRLLYALAPNSGDVAYQEKLIPALQTLGRLLAVKGQVGAAATHLRQAVATAERLVPAEPNNSRWIDFAASAHLTLARFEQSRGDHAAAGGHITKGCAYAASLRRPGGASSWKMAQWSCLDRRLQMTLVSGEAGRAATLAEQTVALARGSKSGDPTSDAMLIARSLLVAGDAYRSANMPARAVQAWQQGLALASTVATPWEQSVRADLLGRVGQMSEAQRVQASLQSRGFRNLEMLRT